MHNYKTYNEISLIAETALESVLAGFWDWNMVTNEEYLSPRFKEMFGYSDDEMENKPESWQKIAFQEDLPLMFQSFENHIKSKGKIPFNSIVRYHHKNGGIVWVKCSGKVVEWSKDNTPLRAIGCHIDITDEKEVELYLKKTLTEKEVLIKEVHHRVKNNLQLILSLSKLKEKNGVIETKEIEDSITSISLAYEAIYKVDKIDNISIDEYIKEILKTNLIGTGIKYNITQFKYQQIIDNLVPLGLIITELITNSIKHNLNNINFNHICIEFNTEDDVNSLIYSDNGIGYSDDFLKNNNHNSFGILIIQGLIDQLNAKINFFNNKGACAKITFNF